MKNQQEKIKKKLEVVLNDPSNFKLKPLYICRSTFEGWHNMERFDGLKEESDYSNEQGVAIRRNVEHLPSHLKLALKNTGASWCHYLSGDFLPHPSDMSSGSALDYIFWGEIGETGDHSSTSLNNLLMIIHTLVADIFYNVNAIQFNSESERESASTDMVSDILNHLVMFNDYGNSVMRLASGFIAWGINPCGRYIAHIFSIYSFLAGNPDKYPEWLPKDFNWRYHERNREEYMLNHPLIMAGRS